MEVEIDFDEEVILPRFRTVFKYIDVDIDFLYGGRDSGKSKFIAQRLVLDCLFKPYFRQVLIRKTANTIKDSQWQMIKDTVEEWGLDEYFTFKIHPLEIHCKNGNKFICRGLDEPGKLKSITNPSGAWIEEGNQITEQDFIFILTTLRSSNGNVKLDFTFNPEANTPNYKDFWLFRQFFGHTTEKSFTHKIVYEIGQEKVELNYRATHSTYHDNPYVTPQRKAFHESLKTTNYYWYKIFTLGEWGNEENKSPWLFSYSRAKHVKAGLQPVKNLTLDLSWDFNRDPICCSIIQHDEKARQVRILETIKIPKSGVDEVCQQIKVKYPGYLYRVTGDYSGDTATSLFQEHVTNYTLIKRHLKLSKGQIKIEPNPRLEKNRTLVNLVFQYYDIVADEKKASAFIFDCENVRSTAEGKIEKKDRDDPAQQADALDTVRYWINMFMKGFEKKYVEPPSSSLKGRG